MPPSEASAPGSIGKNRPWSRKYSFSALRVTPGSITQSRSSAWTSSTLFMSRRSMQMPPAGALTWPSSEVPVPNAMTGTPCLAQIRTVSWMSDVSCAITTPSGGCAGSHVVVWACCSRTACEVISLLPNRAASCSSALASACGRGRFGSLVVSATSVVLPAILDRGKGYIRGQETCPPAIGCMMTTATALKDMPLPPAPFKSSVMQIEPQWIDYNGHLNMAYYNVMMDRAIDELWLQLGIGPAYMKERHGSTFTAECHVRYLREIHLGDPAQVTVYLLGADEKRIHTFEELRHATEGWISATSENITLHIDMSARKVAPFLPDIRARIAAIANVHAAVPRPEGIGRKVAMPSPK